MQSRRRRALSCAMAVALIGVLGVMSSSSSAAENKISLDLKNTSIETALASLFQGTGKNYVLAPGVTGTVTLSLRDVPFEQALQATVRSAGLTYKLEDNVYVIRPKEPTNNNVSTNYRPPEPTPVDTSRAGQAIAELLSAEIRIEKIQLNFIDAVDVATIFGGEALFSRTGSQHYGAIYGSPYGYGMGGGAYGIPGFSLGGYSGYGGSSGYYRPYSGYSSGYYR